MLPLLLLTLLLPLRPPLLLLPLLLLPLLLPLQLLVSLLLLPLLLLVQSRIGACTPAGQRRRRGAVGSRWLVHWEREGWGYLQ